VQDLASTHASISASILGITPHHVDDSLASRASDSKSSIQNSNDTEERHFRRRLVAASDDYWATFGDSDRSRHRHFSQEDQSHGESDFDSDSDDEPRERRAKAFIS
jgi:hypothetical protein